MSRVKRGSTLRNKHKKLLKETKGFRGAPNRLAAIAERAFINAETSAYRDRRNKKRTIKRLWIIRINAAVRQLGLRYSTFIDLLHKADFPMNRKQLADLAMHDFPAFKQLVEQIKIKAAV